MRARSIRVKRVQNALFSVSAYTYVCLSIGDMWKPVKTAHTHKWTHSNLTHHPCDTILLAITIDRMRPRARESLRAHSEIAQTHLAGDSVLLCWSSAVRDLLSPNHSPGCGALLDCTKRRPVGETTVNIDTNTYTPKSVYVVHAPCIWGHICM